MPDKTVKTVVQYVKSGDNKTTYQTVFPGELTKSEIERTFLFVRKLYVRASQILNIRVIES